LAKIQQNWTKPWNFEKAKQLTFSPGLKQVVRFLADDEQMVMNMDMILCALIHKASAIQIWLKQTAWLLLRTVAEESKAQNRHS
jgi:hypothetical protein